MLNNNADEFEKYRDPNQDEDEFEKYRDPNQEGEKSKQQNSLRENNFIENSPYLIKKMVDSLLAVSQSTLPNRLSAVKRGAQDVGEGLKQTFLEKFGNEDAAKHYTSQKESERNAYENTPAGQEPYSQLIRSGVSSLPMLAAGGGLGLARGLLAKVISGGLGGATAAGTQFIPEGDTRATNAIAGGLIGAGVPLAPAVLSKMATPFIKALRPLGKYEEAAKTAALDHEAVLNETKDVLRGTISKNPKTELGQIEDTLGRTLNINAPHSQRVAKLLTNRVNDIEKYWKQGFTDLNKKIESIELKVPEIEEGKNVDLATKINNIQKEGKLLKVQDIQELSNQKDISPDFAELLEKAPKPNDSSASDFLAKYQGFKDKLFKMRQLTKQNIDPVYRKQLFKDIDKGQKIADTMQQTLEKGLGEHAEEFKRLNEGYSTQVYPLRGNPTVRKALKTGKLSKNMIEELSGSGQGRELVRELVKQDPEMLKNVLGQRYASKAEELHNPNELTQEYLNETPEIQKLFQQKEQTLKKYSLLKDISLKNKIEAEELLKQMKKGQMKSRLLLGGIVAAYGLPKGFKKAAGYYSNQGDQ